MRTTQRKSGTATATWVVAAVLILLGVTLPIYGEWNYEHKMLQAKETVLRQDLYTLRRAIEEYTEEKQRAPQALRDIVTAGYLRILPKDQFTGSSDSWQVGQSNQLSSGGHEKLRGIIDVHSGSNMTASDGSKYSTW